MDIGSLRDEPHGWQPKILQNGQINVLIPRAAESIAPDSGAFRGARGSTRQLQIEIGIRTSGKRWEVAGGWWKKCRGIVVVSGAAVKPNRPSRAEAAES